MTVRGNGRRPNRATGVCVAGMVLAALAQPLAVHAQQWRTTSDKDGIRLETRAVPGERFDELRASTLVPVAPQLVADFLVGDYLDEKNRNIRRTFVKRAAAVTIWSDLVTAPAVAARCYSMRFERSSATAGEVTIRFSTDEYIGAKPDPDCITLRARGRWSMRPVGDATRLTYTSLTDIGGSTPAMLVRRSLSSAAVDSVRKVVAGALGLQARRQETDDPAD